MIFQRVSFTVPSLPLQVGNCILGTGWQLTGSSLSCAGYLPSWLDPAATSLPTVASYVSTVVLTTMMPGGS
jgi:hypothetical protein